MTLFCILVCNNHNLENETSSTEDSLLKLWTSLFWLNLTLAVEA